MSKTESIRTGMFVEITDDCRSRLRKLLHGGDLTGKIGYISATTLLVVDGEVWGMNYPEITVGKHVLRGLDCWWIPADKPDLRPGDSINVRGGA